MNHNATGGRDAVRVSDRADRPDRAGDVRRERPDGSNSLVRAEVEQIQAAARDAGVPVRSQSRAESRHDDKGAGDVAGIYAAAKKHIAAERALQEGLAPRGGGGATGAGGGGASDSANAAAHAARARARQLAADSRPNR